MIVAWAVFVKDRNEMLEDGFGGLAVYSNPQGAEDAVGSPSSQEVYTICKVKIERLP